MTVIVTDTGFDADDWDAQFLRLQDLPANHSPVLAIDLAPGDDPAALAPQIDQIDMVRINFPSSADGRGFTLARRLRSMGFQGRLRAQGHVIADQYAMARRSGFDEVEIDDALAARQPEDQWQFRANWRDHDYQSQLRTLPPRAAPFI